MLNCILLEGKYYLVYVQLKVQYNFILYTKKNSKNVYFGSFIPKIYTFDLDL